MGSGSTLWIYTVILEIATHALLKLLDPTGFHVSFCYFLITCLQASLWCLTAHILVLQLPYCYSALLPLFIHSNNPGFGFYNGLDNSSTKTPYPLISESEDIPYTILLNIFFRP